VSNIGASAGWGLVVAASLLAGALAAASLRLPERVAATVTSFGGGVLLAAVALELVPEADAEAGAWPTALGLLAGTLVFVGADAWLTRDEGMEAMRRFQPRGHGGPPDGAAAESRRGGARRGDRRRAGSSTACPSRSRSG
jgi:ZIP family zinc transporter